MIYVNHKQYLESFYSKIKGISLNFPSKGNYRKRRFSRDAFLIAIHTKSMNQNIEKAKSLRCGFPQRDS